MGKIPWWRAWQSTPVISPGEFHAQRSLTGYGSQGRKESDTTERLTTKRWTAQEYNHWYNQLCSRVRNNPRGLRGWTYWLVWLPSSKYLFLISQDRGRRTAGALAGISVSRLVTTNPPSQTEASSPLSCFFALGFSHSDTAERQLPHGALQRRRGPLSLLTFLEWQAA